MDTQALIQGTLPAARRRAGDAPGFTLIELAIVLLIMGLMLLIATPYLGGFRGAQLKSEVRRLASRASYLYQEAAAQKVLLRLTFDLDRNGYFVTRLDPFAAKPAFAAERGPAGVRALMPPGVRIRDVWVEGAGSFQRGTISCQFYPSGSADAAMIHLADASGNVFTMGINPFSGRVAIISGDVGQARLAELAR
jgi:prepilin-type N-terminal cleavage/methylation domain-containing protein